LAIQDNSVYSINGLAGLRRGIYVETDSPANVLEVSNNVLRDIPAGEGILMLIGDVLRTCGIHGNRVSFTDETGIKFQMNADPATVLWNLSVSDNTVEETVGVGAHGFHFLIQAQMDNFLFSHNLMYEIGATGFLFDTGSAGFTTGLGLVFQGNITRRCSGADVAYTGTDWATVAYDGGVFIGNVCKDANTGAADTWAELAVAMGGLNKGIANNLDGT